jgi:hypothetical protein
VNYSNALLQLAPDLIRDDLVAYQQRGHYLDLYSLHHVLTSFDLADYVPPVEILYSHIRKCMHSNARQNENSFNHLAALCHRHQMFVVHTPGHYVTAEIVHDKILLWDSLPTAVPPREITVLARALNKTIITPADLGLRYAVQTEAECAMRSIQILAQRVGHPIASFITTRKTFVTTALRVI